MANLAFQTLLLIYLCGYIEPTLASRVKREIGELESSTVTQSNSTLRDSRSDVETGKDETKAIYIYRCSGPFAQYTDNKCHATGESEVCYFNDILSNYYSCVPLCDGVEKNKIDECEVHTECRVFLGKYCPLKLKEQPTTTTTTTTTTTQQPTTSPPKPTTTSTKKSDPQQPPLDKVDEYKKEIQSVGESSRVTKGTSALPIWQIIVIAVAVCTVAIVPTAYIGQKYYRESRGRRVADVESGAHETEMMDLGPSSANQRADDSSTADLTTENKDLSRNPVTTTAQQISHDPKDMEQVSLLRPKDQQCTDTNDGEHGRAPPAKEHRRMSV